MIVTCRKQYMPNYISANIGGFPGGSDGKESACSAGNPGSVPGSGRVHWRREWQPTPVFLPREFPERSLVGYSLWGHQESEMTE